MQDKFIFSKFAPDEKVISLVSHPPEIQPGDLVTIVKPWTGYLCAVQLPDGMIHRWFASFELESVESYPKRPYEPGGNVKVLNTEGHGNPPPVEVGTTIKVVRCIPTTFYDVILSNGEYHRWLADFELANPI